MDKYIEEELTTFYGKTFSRTEDTKDWLRKSYKRAIKKALEEQKKEILYKIEDIRGINSFKKSDEITYLRGDRGNLYIENEYIKKIDIINFLNK